MATHSIRIVIRYYDAEGTVIFEDVPNLAHQVRVPLQWVRWEIYWDGELVQSGRRISRADPRTQGQPRHGSRGDRASRDAGSAREGSAFTRHREDDPTDRDAASWAWQPA